MEEQPRNSMLRIIAAIALSCIVSASFPFVGGQAAHALAVDADRSPDEAETDFYDSNGRFVLKQASERLISQLDLLPERAFPKLPNGWTKDRIKTVVSGIKLLPDQRKIRARRALMFDHNEKNQTITAMEPFFIIYGLLPQGKDLSRDQLKDIETKILRETAGLWRSNDRQAEKFATDILSLFDRDIVFCKGEFKMSSVISYRFIVSRAWREGGIVVTPELWAISPDMPSYKDMQARGINSDLFKSIVAGGAGENPIIGIEKSIGTPEQVKINFKLTKIDYETDNGKGEFVDIDGKPHPLDCQNILTVAPEPVKTGPPRKPSDTQPQ